MITTSNINITRENGNAPTLYDIGYALSKMPRFGGHTVKNWTVLHHLYACAQYAHLSGGSVKVQIYALLHDAHEAVTGDIPQPWKTDDTRALQKELDVRIYNSLHLSLPDMVTERTVKQIDNQMVYDEARWCCPQVAAAILRPGPNYCDSINPQDRNGGLAVQKAIEMLDSIITDPHACANDFRRYYELLTMDYDSPNPAAATEDSDD